MQRHSVNITQHFIWKRLNTNCCVALHFAFSRNKGNRGFQQVELFCAGLKALVLIMNR